MEDKIEVGEYVISKNRLVLGQVIEMRSNTELIISTLLQNGFRHEIPIAINNIKKHSKNIFELLESEDIVTLEYYVSKYRKRIKRNFETFKVRNFINFDNIHCDFLYDLSKQKFLDGKGYNVKIKDIVTKEQFKQVQYEV